MKFAIIILIVLMLASIIGTFIPQNQSLEFYETNFPRMADFIIFMKFDHIYTSFWYIIIGIFLSLSIFFCIVVKFRPILNIIKNKSIKNDGNFLALWLLHLGLIMIILFFVIGNATAYQTSIYNVKDSTSKIEDSKIRVKILDFDILLTNDHIDQYISKVEFYDDNNKLIDKGEISVNHPISIDGYQFSQASFGYYVNAEVFKDGEKIGLAALLENEYIAIDEKKLIISLNRFYPDVVNKDGEIFNNSKIIKKPMIEYTAFLGSMPIKTELIDVNQEIEILNYKIKFKDPDYYPILDVRKDRFEELTGLGAFIFMAGMILLFFGPKKEKE